MDDAERAVRSVELIFNGELCGRWSKCSFLYLPHAGAVT